MATYISVSEIKDGMVLAESVLNKFGQTLLGSGMILNEKHQNTFKSWNIVGVMIKGEKEEDDAEKIHPELKKRAWLRIRKRISWQPELPIEKDLIEMVIFKMVKMPNIK